MNFDDIVEQPEYSLNPAWRLHAIKLAVEKKLAGRAKMVTFGENFAVYTCPSQSSPHPHYVTVFPNGVAICDCDAGSHRSACAHAGSVLLLWCRLAPEDVVTEPPVRR